MGSKFAKKTNHTNKKKPHQKTKNLAGSAVDTLERVKSSCIFWLGRDQETKSNGACWQLILFCSTDQKNKTKQKQPKKQKPTNKETTHSTPTINRVTGIRVPVSGIAYDHSWEVEPVQNRYCLFMAFSSIFFFFLVPGYLKIARAWL